MLSLAVLAAFAAPAIAIAQTAPAAAPSPVTGNMTIASDYRFRGISQTYRGPAIQGGIDYAHDSGFYIGNWNSNVSSVVYTAGSAIEMDFYGGWKKAFGDFGLDLGFLYYYYPNAEFNGKKFNNQELYVGGSWKWISAKYSYAISDYFGLNREQAAGGYWANQNRAFAPLGDHGNSKGTQYFDLTATYPVSDKFSVIGHVGKLKVKHYSELDYTDWKLGATYDLSGWVLGASFVTTNAKKDWYYTGTPGVGKGIKNTGESTVVLSVAKTF
jgi:uncharacterized protein (TIGR02001 family)